MNRFKNISVSAILFVFLFGNIGTSLAVTANDDFQGEIQKLREDRQSFQGLKSEYDTAKADEAKAKVASLREAAKKKAEEAQKKMEEKRKEVLLRLIDVQIKQYNKTQERIEKMPNIDAALKAELLTEIEKAIQKLNEEKTKVENAVTKEEIKNLAKEIQGLFKTQRETVEKIVEAILASRLNTAITKAETRVNSIELKIQELKKAGKDTVQMETLLSEVKTKLTEAKTKLSEKKVKEANQSLKDVYQKLREIIRLAKETGVVKEEETETE